MTSSKPVPLPELESRAVEATIESIAQPGATLDGARRNAIAEVIRETIDGPEPSPSDPELKLAVLFTNEAHTIRESVVSDILQSGVSAATYVEILSLSSRLTAVDTAHFALGLEPAPMVAPSAGEPTGNIDTNAAIDGGWVPTVGPAFPPTALSMLPDENQAMHELHGALYLSIPQMADSDIDRGLHRTQMEFAAARTSLLNECFF